MSSSVRAARLDTGCAGDVARTGTDGERILLQADERESGSGGVGAATLYLTAREPRSLAGLLARTVRQIESA